MLKNKQTSIKQEFVKYLDFWMDEMIFGNPKKVFPEISIDNIPNKSGLMGSMYLSRILYGASKACDALKGVGLLRFPALIFVQLVGFWATWRAKKAACAVSISS